MQTTAINHSPDRAATVAPARSSGRMRSIARIVAILGALLIEAILVLGLVVLSLGIGAEVQPRLGPDRPPPPPVSAP